MPTSPFLVPLHYYRYKHRKYILYTVPYNHLPKIFLNNTIELWSIEAIKRCVASNLGISFLPRFTVEEELENGKLKELEIGCSDTKITAIYAYHKNKWISPAMSLFMQLVRESFNID
ncbi:LysR substrate-binding domain-containing protein [Clostridium scatologenes]|uniref:LysR substrate-binding domain-containing protein n=1 Tax=Clostridium scatologenes TaxID=1548 RepID=UPI0005FBA7A1